MHQTRPVITIAALRDSAQRIPSPFVQRALLSAIDSAHGDVKRVQANVEAWFDSGMDRVSGHYKRRAQIWLFVIGLGTTLLLNVNTIAISDYLAHNEATRAALVQRAEQIRQDPTYRSVVTDSAAVERATAHAVYEDLQSLKLPIGWDRQLPPPAGGSFWYRIKQIVGLLITAFAIMLGAPFWFDLLNKFMVIRSTVKPTEKSPDEASEDRQKGKAKDEPTVVVADLARTNGGGQSRDAAQAGAMEAAADTTTPVPAVERPYEEREWANARDPREGII